MNTQRGARLRSGLGDENSAPAWTQDSPYREDGTCGSPARHKPGLDCLLRAIGLDEAYEQGEGDLLAYRRDGQETEVVDFVGGYGTLLLGHHHPDIVAEMMKFLSAPRANHVQGSLRPGARALAKALHERIGGDYCTGLANSGTEAVEAAFKHALLETRGRTFIALQGAFHGKTFGALQATANPRFRQPFCQVPSNVVHITIAAVHHSCFPPGAMAAVRSSAIAEDGTCYSFAGMYESVLGIQEQQDLLTAIKRLWVSAFSPRVVAYRQHDGLPFPDMDLAVIVQQMVDATSSGVCFTCDPLTGSNPQICISAVWGLGEGLVSHGFPADTYRIDKDSLAPTVDVVDKSEQLIVDRQTGQVQRIAVNPAQRKLAALSPEQVLQIAKLGSELESAAGCPQDVEFCFELNGSLSILQSRPVTSRTGLHAPDRRAAAAENHIVWDNSNIIESYSGVTTPMTFSFVRRAGGQQSACGHAGFFKVSAGAEGHRLAALRGPAIRLRHLPPG